METSEKRKREEIHDDDDDHGKKIIGTERVSPTVEEHEVEEFYTILRRMQVALKYFHDKRGQAEEGWRMALEREVAADTAAVAEAAEEQNAVLDLNATPQDDVTVPPES